jgi:hypothetical protein
MYRKRTCLACLVLVLGCTLASYGDVDLGKGLVAWWPFDEGTGNVAYDGSGNNNNATLMYGATWVTPGAPGKEGYAISLNGTSAFLRVEHSPTLDVTKAVTFEMWVYYTGTPADAIMVKGASGDGNAWKNLGIRLDDDPVTYRQLNWRSRGGDTVNALNSGTGLPLSEWTHIAVTFDVDAPGNNQKIYINGKLDAENRSANPLTTNAGPLFLGAETYTQPAGRWFFQGMLDEGSLYNRALNPVEIKTIAGVKDSTDPTPRNGSTVSTTDVLLEWWQGSNVAAVNGHHVYFSDQVADVNTGAAAADKGFTTDPNYRVTNLVPGKTYYWRVDEVNDVHPDKIWPGGVWSFTVASAKAAVPNPSDGALYVNRNRVLSWAPGTGAVSHHVYFGVDQTKVVAGAADVDRGIRTEPNYAPETLKHDTIYYWRVDESDGTTTHQGDIWSFETTASNDPNLVAWWPFDDGYLDVSGNEHHGRPVNDANIVTVNTRPYAAANGVLHLNGTDECVYVPYSPSLNITTAGTVAMWVYGGAGYDAPIRHGGWNASYSFRLDNAATRRFQFRTTGAAPGLLSNTALPTAEWTHIALTFDYTVPDPGTNQKFYFNGKLDAESRGATAIGGNLYYVAIGGREAASAMWGGMIDDVRLYNRALAVSEIQVVMTGDPNLAIDPKPADRSVPDEPHATPLSWKAGANAEAHDVYFGTDAGAVQNSTPAEPLGVYQGRQAETTFTPAEPLQWGQTYYWRVDEVKEGHPKSPWKGMVWSSTVANYLIVDDFESYLNDSPNRLFQTWIDGFGFSADSFFPAGSPGNGTGAAVGHDIWSADSPQYGKTIAETTIVNGGKQSMPIYYNNTTLPCSEAQRTWTAAQDWTTHGSDTLTLAFRGAPVGFMEKAPGQILMSGTGTDIYGTSDQGRFVYKQLTGDGSIIARIDRLDNTNAWAKAGVMIRGNLEAIGSWAYILYGGENGVRFQARLSQGATATSDTELGPPAEQIALRAPIWVKAERKGDQFNGYYSTDGTTWTALAWNPRTISMNSSAYIGLAVTSHATGAVAQAEFSGVTTTGTVTGQWESVSLGVEQTAGNLPDPLYVTLEDSGGRKATVTHADPSAANIGAWTPWSIPLSTFSSAGVKIDSIKKMSIGIGDKVKPASGATGLLYIDDIRVVKPVSQ